MKKENKTKKKRWGLLLLLLLFIVILTGIALFFLSQKNNKNGSGINTTLQDSLKRAELQGRLDSTRLADSLKNVADSLAKDDSLLLADSLRLVEDSIKAIQIKIDSVNRAKEDSIKRVKEVEDSLELVVKDSIKRADSLTTLLTNMAKPCSDTTAPWVYPDPSGGLHYGETEIKFSSTKACSIFYSFDTTKEFSIYQKEKITIKNSSTLFYRAVDSCGNQFELNSKKYTIQKEPIGHCPVGMVGVVVDDKSFCIDKYEWPNKEGGKPQSNVTLAQAMDSCFTAGKRLCSALEWESACSGTYNWRYPYGDKYSQKACVTQGKKRRKSGDAGECRSWNAAYDMVGNLAEWTSTKAPEDKGFNIVKGGFWESGSRGSCNSSRYSYYPQNHHNPVGFRCCKDSK
jgi:hypothetical protein